MPDLDKVRIYPYATNYLDDPRPVTWDLSLHPNPKMHDDGTVWSGKKRVAFWYALIGPGTRLLVRRDKLNDLEHIEALRWKAIERMHGPVWDRRKKAIARANELGRIYYDGQFYYADDSGQPQRRRDKDEGGQKDEVINKLAQIPTPDEEEAGAEYEAADEWLRSYWSRIGNISEILRTAMRIHPGVPRPSYTEASRTKTVSITYHLNGRLYVSHTPNGYGNNTTEVWPNPGDDNYKIGLTKQIFRRCSICGLKHSRKVRTCEHCPRDRPEPRKSWPRGGLLRDNRNRRRLGRKLD